MSMNPDGTLVVEGSCKKCRQAVKTTAAPGRSTWRGPCPNCKAPGVYASRSKAAAFGEKPTPPSAAPVDPATNPGRGGKTKRKAPRATYTRNRPPVVDPENEPDPLVDPGSGEHPPAEPEPPRPDPDPLLEREPVRSRSGKLRARLRGATNPGAGVRRHPYGELFPW